MTRPFSNSLAVRARTAAYRAVPGGSTVDRGLAGLFKVARFGLGWHGRRDAIGGRACGGRAGRTNRSRVGAAGFGIDCTHGSGFRADTIVRPRTPGHLAPRWRRYRLRSVPTPSAGHQGPAIRPAPFSLPRWSASQHGWPRPPKAHGRGTARRIVVEGASGSPRIVPHVNFRIDAIRSASGYYVVCYPFFLRGAEGPMAMSGAVGVPWRCSAGRECGVRAAPSRHGKGGGLFVLRSIMCDYAVQPSNCQCRDFCAP
jgi:hypothetical protein